MSSRSSRDRVTDISKRILDLGSAFIGLVILSPLLLLVTIAIKLDSRGPVFFRQTRIGRNGTPFQIFKFRSMVTEQPDEALSITSADDERVTAVGAWLRKYKIDELPQLLNVLQGDMSLVGPRPELPEYVAMYPPAVKDLVLSVRPGITDFAAIEFRDESSMLAEAEDPEQFYIEQVLPRKLELYVRYVSERSLFLDIRLIMRTLARLWT